MWSDKFFVSYGMSNKCIQRRLELLQRWDDLGCKALCTALEAGSRTVCESIWVKGRFKNALLGSTNDLRKLCLDSYFDFLKNITAALRAPILGGNFAVWADLSALFQWHYRHSPSENLRVWRDAISQPEGGTFSCFDCSLQYIRRLEICFFPYPKSWSLGAAVPFLLSWFLIFYDPNITGTIPNSIHFPHLEGKTITGMQLHRASSLVACSKTCRHGLRFGNGATWGNLGHRYSLQEVAGKQRAATLWLVGPNTFIYFASFLCYLLELQILYELFITLFVFAKGQAKRSGGMDCMEYVESTSSFVISGDSESLLFVESLNLEVWIWSDWSQESHGISTVKQLWSICLLTKVQLSKGAPLVKLPGGVLLAIIEGVAALLMRPSKRKKGRVGTRRKASHDIFVTAKHAKVAKGCETQGQETMNHWRYVC